MNGHTPRHLLPISCEYTSNHAHDYRLFKPDGSPLPVNTPANDHSEQRAMAKYIEKACNSHAALVEALQRAHEFIHDLLDAKESEAIDLLTNQGTDVESDLTDALALAAGKEGGK
jgi:hypothetical protein